MSCVGDRFIRRPKSISDASHTLTSDKENESYTPFTLALRKTCFQYPDTVGVYQTKPVRMQPKPLAFRVEHVEQLDYPLDDGSLLHQSLFDSQRCTTAAICESNTMYVVVNGHVLESLSRDVRESSVKSVAVCKTEPIVAFVDDTNTMHLLDEDTATTVQRQTMQLDAALFATPLLSWCRSQRMISIASGNKIGIYDWRTTTVGARARADNAVVELMAGQNSDLFAVRLRDDTVAVYDQRQMAKPFYKHLAAVSAMSWAPHASKTLTLVDKKTSRLQNFNLAKTALLSSPPSNNNNNNSEAPTLLLSTKNGAFPGAHETIDMHWLDNGLQLVSLQQNSGNLFLKHFARHNLESTLQLTTATTTVDFGVGISCLNQATQTVHVVSSELETMTLLRFVHKQRRPNKKRAFWMPNDAGSSSSSSIWNSKNKIR